MVVADAFVKVVGHTRIENMFDSLFDKGYRYGRASVLAGKQTVSDGMVCCPFNIHFPIRGGEGYHFKAEIGEEGVPKGEQLIHI